MFKIKRVRTMLRLAKRRLQRRFTIDDISTEVSFLYPPPDGGWGWVVVLAAFVHSMLITGFHNSFGVYMLSLLETFQSSNSKIAWIGSVSYAFIMIFGPVSGKLLQKYGAIKVAIIGALVVMFGLISSSYTYDLRVLFLTHGILVGVGSSLASTPALIMVSLYFTTKRSFATGIVMAGGATGTLVQNIFHQYLIETLGWRASLRVYSGILTICILAAFAYKPLQKHRAHPSVVEKFQTSPLRGFIMDLNLWKDRVFEVWVCSLGLAKFGFFIPFVHMIKLAGDLGISPKDASYIMVGSGLTSMISCILFGKICDMERINRLYVNQASILSVGVVNFIIPYCKNFYSLVAICSLWGFFDAGNYVLLPVLTFDLMGPEKMTIAWGFMMAVNAISCFGPPFAGAMYDLFGNYNIGFIVTGICNIIAASILAFIPWLTDAAKQSKKNYLNVSVCEVTKTILPWQSPSSSLVSISSSYMESRRVSLEVSEHSLSDYSKKPSVKSLKSILKSEVTSFKSLTSPETGTSSPHRKEDGVIFVDVEKHDSDQFQQFESTADLTSKNDEPQSETASLKSVTSASVKQTEHDTSFSDRKGGVVFVDAEKHDSALLEQAGSTAKLSPMENESRSEIASFKGMSSGSIKQTEQIHHSKEDGVAFLGVEDYGSAQKEQFGSATGLTPMEDLNLATSETSVSMKQAKGIPHRKENGVAFLDIEDTDSDLQEHFENATDLWSLEDLTTLERGTSAPMKQAKGIPHRKEDGVAFLDIEDSDSDLQEHLESATDLWSLENLTTLEKPAFKRGTSRSMKETEGIPYRKEDGVAFLDIEDSARDLQEHLESASDLWSLEDLTTRETSAFKRGTSASLKQTKVIPHRKGDGVAFSDIEDSARDLQEHLESATDLWSLEDVTPLETSAFKRGTSGSMKEAECIPYRKDDGVAFLDIEDSDLQEHLESTTDLWSLEDLTTPERGTSASMKQAEGIPYRKEDGVAFLDIEDSASDLQEHLEDATDLLPEHLAVPETEFSSNKTSASVKHTAHMHSTLHRKGDVYGKDTEKNKVYDSDKQQK
ncbi:uncharacterized protein LOC132573334 [Heteronotia binoei]|uniref:uncharacterized protein LOC132573334 n=1 Tax=Heteronotia binoei TaxID=13085 RepID=UPI00292E7208|nr:uncharacterized protein LOC132573334 [Heteronotia binoei]